MINQTLICGLMLVVVGVGGYFSSTDEKQSPTALIPAGFGAALLVFAMIVIWKEPLRRIMMHLAATIGLVGIIGGFAPVIRKLSKGDEIILTAPSIRNGLLMSVICLLFVLLCIKSFLEARKMRQAV